MMPSTSQDGEPLSPTNVRPLVSPRRPRDNFSAVNAAQASPINLTHPATSPQPPRTSLYLPQASKDNVSLVTTTELVGAPTVSDSIPSFATPDESPRYEPSADISNSSSIENLTVLPQLPSFGEHRIRKHRKNAASFDSAVPRQTILKALQSRPPTSQSIDSMVMEDKKSAIEGKTRRSKSITHKALADALSELNLKSGDIAINKMAALASPCFFHKKFDKAVNLEKVLEEIADDDSISHSRLMQTAFSVREVSKQLQRRPIKMTVRNVMIVTKARDNALVHLTRELAEWLLT